MSSPAALIVLSSTLLLVAMVVGFLAYTIFRYTPIISRVFEEKPMFLPLRAGPFEGGEDVRFSTADGLELVGTYWKARSEGRAGVMVFCHEYLGDRWSAMPYAEQLLDRGFDLFSFDFRNHGQSSSDPDYAPLQWVTDHELNDLRAALAYLRSRDDADPAGVGLFGVSRGGGTALCVAGHDPRVWGVVTDGAFPTRGMMLAYIVRWAEIFVGNGFLWKLVPIYVFDLLAWVSRLRTQARLGCRYANVERGVARIAPRPWLAIHGAKDAYIGVDIARKLFDRAGDPKELWIVDGAKHNRCREREPVAYAARVAGFVGRSAPRVWKAPTVLEPVASPASVVALHELLIPADLGVAVGG